MNFSYFAPLLKDIKKHFSLFCILTYSVALFAQYDSGFISPLNAELIITGSYGEIRDNHFHSGLDFSVGEKEGKPVYAVEDGIVSRIKISPVGYGKAIYIDHPNGLTSVYGHLQKYNAEIGTYARENQYKQKSFEVDLFPVKKKDKMPVKKGDLIGYAGNTGSSGGPHLHFELRNTKTEHTLNPLLYGIDAPDNYNPYIDFIVLYPDDANSYINEKNEYVKFFVKKISPQQYVLTSKDTLKAWGKVYFGIQAFDHNYRTSNRNGWYKLQTEVDGKEIFSMSCDKFSFDETRYINASMDYNLKYNNNNQIVITKKIQGNKLSFFNVDENKGVVNFNRDTLHQVRMQIEDLSGRFVSLDFYIHAAMPANYIEKKIEPKNKDIFFAYDQANCFRQEDIVVNIPKGALYDDIDFIYNKTEQSKAFYSPVHAIHTPGVPLQTKIDFKIKTYGLPETLQSKALLARIDDSGKKKAVYADFTNGFVVGRSNVFGKYAVVVDTVKPNIKPSKNNKKGGKSLNFFVTDNFSGIKKYTGKVNHKWVLVEYEAKDSLMTYHIDHVAGKGKNYFELEVEDYKGNKARYATVFYK